MRIHPHARVITVSLHEHEAWPPHPWRTRPRRTAATKDSWLLTLNPNWSGHGETQLLLPGPSHEVPTNSFVAPRTVLTYRITDTAFVVKNIGVTPDLWRLGIATALATRTHQLLAPTLQPLIDSSFVDEKGESWAAAMCSRGWELAPRHA